MFYNRLKQLCKSKNTSITAVLKALNISTSKGTAWKNGSAPSSEIVIKLAEYFDVSTDFLLGLSDELHRKIKLSDVDTISPSYPNEKFVTKFAVTFKDEKEEQNFVNRLKKENISLSIIQKSDQIGLLMEQAKLLSDEDLQKVIEYAELLKLKSNDKK
jgi:transcriptional regulator with XRE-family HTH domain